MSTGNEVFDELVAASGLSVLFAGSALRRTLVRTGVDPDRVTWNDIARAAPEIERTLALYLAPTDAAARIRAIRAKAAG